MNIKEFSHNLQKLYQEMSDSFSSFQKKSGLSCMASCGRCCVNPEIEVSLYEMIPMALAIYEVGNLDEWLHKLTTSSQNYCLAYVHGENEGEGKCGRYNERPSVCRMFGVAGYRNKKNEVTLSICKFLKNHYGIEQAPTNLDPNETPMMVDWSYKLSSLDQRIIQEKMPINEALLKALEKVSLYAEYQNS
jgi:uncharacterized protein